MGCLFYGGVGTGVDDDGGVGDCCACDGNDVDAAEVSDVAGTEWCEPGDCSARILSSLVELSKVEEEFTCPGREGAELGIPVCYTSGGIGFGEVAVFVCVEVGMIVTGGEVFGEGGGRSGVGCLV